MRSPALWKVLLFVAIALAAIPWGCESQTPSPELSWSAPVWTADSTQLHVVAWSPDSEHVYTVWLDRDSIYVIRDEDPVADRFPEADRLLRAAAGGQKR